MAKKKADKKSSPKKKVAKKAAVKKVAPKKVDKDKAEPKISRAETVIMEQHKAYERIQVIDCHIDESKVEIAALKKERAKLMEKAIGLVMDDHKLLDGMEG